jgi:hypothetical protein
MTFTEEDLEPIKAAILSGELRVRTNDREVQFRSMDELLKAKAIIEAGVVAASGTPARRQIRLTTSKGF